MSATESIESPGKVKAEAIAKYYDTTAPTIYKWAKDGKIPCIRFGGTVRFDFEAVRNAIEGGAQ